MTLPLNHEKELCALCVAQLSAEFPSASPGVIQGYARAKSLEQFLRARRVARGFAKAS